jgi:uncharacterized protein YwgA
MCREEIKELKKYGFYNFVPDIYGPRSLEFENDLKHCLNQGLIRMQLKEERVKGIDTVINVYEITDKGMRCLEEQFINIVPRKVIDKMEKIKKIYNSFSLPFILLLVHTRYPEYRIYTV